MFVKYNTAGVEQLASNSYLYLSKNATLDLLPNYRQHSGSKDLPDYCDTREYKKTDMFVMIKTIIEITHL